MRKFKFQWPVKRVPRNDPVTERRYIHVAIVIGSRGGVRGYVDGVTRHKTLRDKTYQIWLVDNEDN